MFFFKKQLLSFLITIVLFSLQPSIFAETLSLREKTPENAVGYLRIPNPWDFFASPPLTDEKRQALKTSLVKSLTKENEVISILLQHLNSPLEVAFLLPEEAPLPFLSLLLSVQLDLNSIEEANALLEKVTTQLPFVEKVSELSAKGYGALTMQEVPVFIHYAVENQTLSLMGGVAASLEKFQQVLKTTTPVEKHRLHNLEAQVDTTHQGFYHWLNLQRLMPFMQATLSPEEAEIWQKLGLSKMQALAVGWGAKAGDSRLKFMLKAPKAGYRELLPKITNNFDLTAAGKPGVFFALTLPTLELLTGIEEILAKEADEEQRAGYEHFKKAFQEKTGFPLEELLNAIATELVVFSDETGVFLAVRVKDKEKWATLLAHLVDKFKLQYETREIQGKQYHHLKTSSMFSAEDMPTDDDTIQGFVAMLLSNLKTHYYWTENKHYLVFSEVPQALIEHQNHPQQVNLQTWLKETQGQDPTSSILLLSANLQNVPRSLYYAYLKILNVIADSVDAELDLFNLPTPSDLNLAHESTYGIQLDLLDSMLTAEMIFENNPLEVFSASDGYIGVAVVGVLAAIAIPAYADYRKRSRVAEAVILLSRLKTPAEEYLINHDQLPKVTEITDKISGKYTKRIWLLESGDGYGAEFNDPDLSGILKLLYDAETETWHCTHEGMQEKYVPASCKD